MEAESWQAAASICLREFVIMEAVSGQGFASKATTLGLQMYCRERCGSADLKQVQRETSAQFLCDRYTKFGKEKGYFSLFM